MRTFLPLLILLCVVFLAACSSKNPKIDYSYDPQKDYSFVADAEDNGIFENPPANKARIYSFRYDTIFGTAIRYNLTLHSHAQATAGFKQGAFLGFSRPGGAFMVDIIPNNQPVYISGKTEAREFISFIPQANRIYCLVSSLQMGFLVGRPLFTLVEKSVCKAYISQYFNADSMQKWQEDKQKFLEKQQMLSD